MASTERSMEAKMSMEEAEGVNTGLDVSLGDPGDYSNNNPYGFIKNKPTKPREQRIKWTADNDRKLLIIGLGKEISAKEYEKIARMFPEQPTPKSIQERLSKLRAEQMDVLRRMNMANPQVKIQQLPVENDQGLEFPNGRDESSPSEPRKRQKTAKAARSPSDEAASEQTDVSTLLRTISSSSGTPSYPETRKRSSSTFGQPSPGATSISGPFARDFARQSFTAAAATPGPLAKDFVPLNVLFEAVAQAKRKEEQKVKAENDDDDRTSG